MSSALISSFEEEYENIDICKISTEEESSLSITKIPDLLLILTVLKKSDFLSSAFVKEHGLKGLSASGLLKKAVMAKIAFSLYKNEDYKILKRLINVEELNLDSCNYFLFSSKGIFWRSTDSKGGPFSMTVSIEKNLLERTGLINIKTLLSERNFSLLFDMDQNINRLKRKKEDLICEF